LEVIVEAYARHITAHKEAAIIFNTAAQAWNHAFSWKSLRPPGGRPPEGAVAALIATNRVLRLVMYTTLHRQHLHVDRQQQASVKGIRHAAFTSPQVQARSLGCT
jgi:hypothetical protein